MYNKKLLELICEIDKSENVIEDLKTLPRSKDHPWKEVVSSKYGDSISYFVDDYMILFLVHQSTMTHRNFDITSERKTLPNKLDEYFIENTICFITPSRDITINSIDSDGYYKHIDGKEYFEYTKPLDEHLFELSCTLPCTKTLISSIALESMLKEHDSEILKGGHTVSIISYAIDTDKLRKDSGKTI